MARRARRRQGRRRRTSRPATSRATMTARTTPGASRRGRARSTTTAGPASPGRRRSAGGAAQPMQAAIFTQEHNRYGVSVGAFAVAIGMAGPTLMQHGTAEQQERFLRPMLRGEEVWCQLFTEPEAGSDLAGISHAGRARRRRVGGRRPEGVDVDGHRQRLGHPARPHRPGRAEAQGHHLLPRRHDLARASTSGRCARSPGEPLQRGVPRRGPHPRRPGARRGARRVGRARSPRCRTSGA